MRKPIVIYRQRTTEKAAKKERKKKRNQRYEALTNFFPTQYDTQRRLFGSQMKRPG